MKKLIARRMKTLTAGALSAAMLLSPAAVFAGVDSGEKSADIVVQEAAAEQDTASEQEAASEQMPAQITEDRALAAALEQISEAVLAVYTAATEGVFAEKPEKLLPCRLSIEPATLRLLNFASETVLKTDLSWIEELGIDLIPTVQTKETPYNSRGYIVDPQDPSLEKVDAVLPGLSAVLHVNGKEILTSDMYVDDRIRGAFVSLPELVSGMAMINMDGMFSSLGWNLRNLGIRVMDPSMMSGAYFRTPNDLKKLLPDAELFAMLLESAGQIADNYKPESAQEISLSAGTITQNCTACTGSLTARDGISLLISLMERVSEDETFRNALIDYINGFYTAYSTNPIVQTLLYQYFERSSIWQLYSYAEDTKVTAAILSGDWKFRREDLNERSAAAADGASAEADDPYGENSYEEAYEAEEYSAEEYETEDEDAYHPEDLQIIPGKAYTWEEYQQLPGDTYSLMRRGLLTGEILLTKSRSFGDNLYICFCAAQDELMDEINKLYYTMDRDALVRITTDFTEEGKLAGIGIEPMYEDTSFGRADIVWPAADDGQGLAFTFSQDGQEYFSAAVQAKMAGTDKNVDVQVSEYEETVFTGNCSVKHEDDLDTLSITAQGEGMETFSLNGQKAAEDTKDVYTLNMEVDGERAAYFDGTIDREEGYIDLGLHIPTYAGGEVLFALTGTFDSQSGNGSFEAAFREKQMAGPSVYSWREDGVIEILTDGLKIREDGTFDGSICVGIKRINAERNPIPSGLKLIIGKDYLKIADDSAVYVTLSNLTESEYLDQDASKTRISELWDTATEYYYGRYTGGRRFPEFDTNWNIGYPLNRLLDAGMPADQLKALPIPMDMTNLQYALEDILDDIF